MRRMLSPRDGLVRSLSSVALALGSLTFSQCSLVGLDRIEEPVCMVDAQCAPRNAREGHDANTCEAYRCVPVGAVRHCRLGPLDADGDGALDARCASVPAYATRIDCDDTDARVHPPLTAAIDASTVAPERCDGVDEDCDGSIDEGVLDTRERVSASVPRTTSAWAVAATATHTRVIATDDEGTSVAGARFEAPLDQPFVTSEVPASFECLTRALGAPLGADRCDLHAASLATNDDATLVAYIDRVGCGTMGELRVARWRDGALVAPAASSNVASGIRTPASDGRCTLGGAHAPTLAASGASRALVVSVAGAPTACGSSASLHGDLLATDGELRSVASGPLGLSAASGRAPIVLANDDTHGFYVLGGDGSSLDLVFVDDREGASSTLGVSGPGALGDVGVPRAAVLLPRRAGDEGDRIAVLATAGCAETSALSLSLVRAVPNLTTDTLELTRLGPALTLTTTARIARPTLVAVDEGLVVAGRPIAALDGAMVGAAGGLVVAWSEDDRRVLARLVETSDGVFALLDRATDATALDGATTELYLAGTQPRLHTVRATESATSIEDAALCGAP